MMQPSGRESDSVRLEGVSYRYPKETKRETIADIDLEILPAQYLLIGGASGSGKSTLVRTFNGLIPHFFGGRLQGRVNIWGQSVRDQSVADCFHRVGLVTQNPQAQLFNRTVLQELAFGLESLGLPRHRIHRRVMAVAAGLDIETLLSRQPHTLSGGEQQLVALASVLSARPAIIVLDEPLANLDCGHVRRLRAVLTDRRAEGMGVVVCEHRMAPTLPDADRLVVLEDGRIRIHGPADQALRDPLWRTSNVELPLAVRIGIEQNRRPLPREIDQIPQEAASRWLQTHPRSGGVSRSDGPEALRVRNICWTLNGRRILDGIDLSLRSGECLAVVGANGAGKTSLLKVVNGLIRPTAGRIWIGGQEATGQPASRRGRTVGTAFQNPDSQFFKLTVAQELSAGPRALDRYDPQWIDALVEMFHLKHLLQRAPFKLSGGEKKRTAFAAALASRPAILVLDEPTAGQDGRFRQALAGAIEQLCARGTAVLIVTHALNFAETVASRWVVMNRGRIAACGPPDEIMSDADLLAETGLEPTERFALCQTAQRSI